MNLFNSVFYDIQSSILSPSMAGLRLWTTPPLSGQHVQYLQHFIHSSNMAFTSNIHNDYFLQNGSHTGLRCKGYQR